MNQMADVDSAKALLERWQTGDQAAATALYERYAQRLCALAQSQIDQRLARRISPDDVVQSVFRTFFRRGGEGQFAIDHSGSLWRLLVQITVNKIHRQREYHHAGRRNVAAEVDRPDNQLHPDVMAHDPTPAEAALLADELEAVLARLEPPEPEIMRLRLQGFAASEIASQVGCSRWTVRRTLDRIGGQLRRRWQSLANE